MSETPKTSEWLDGRCWWSKRDCSRPERRGPVSLGNSSEEGAGQGKPPPAVKFAFMFITAFAGIKGFKDTEVQQGKGPPSMGFLLDKHHHLCLST